MQNAARTRSVKLIQIGNSQGIRLPKTLLRKYGFSDILILEEEPQGIFLRKKDDGKLSWDETYKAMGAEQEDWSDFDEALLDGMGRYYAR